jgi:hypothetical protein
MTKLGKLKEFYEKVQQSLKSDLLTCGDNHKDVDHVHEVCSVCYDNSQKNMQFKFQRDEKTSNFVKVIARMFLKIWQGLWQNTSPPNWHMPISYKDKIIPSPIGMPPFEVAKVPTKFFLTCDPLVDVYKCSMFELHPILLLNFSGERVAEFLKHIYHCKEFKCQHRLISMNRSFTHQHPKYIQS